MDEAGLRAVMSGEKRGWSAAFTRAALRAASVPYGLVARARGLAYDAGLVRAQRASVPVVSIGNITTGGTGKTPMVAWIANWFRRHEMRVALLSRGYKSLSDSANDEKLVLDQLCPGIPHLQQPDRVASAERAVREFGAQVLVLDDGFQHRRLARDLDIVLIDALNPFGYGHLLPRGLLREPLDALKRAGLVVLTRADQCAEDAKTEIRRTLAKFSDPNDLIEVAFVPVGLRNASGEVVDLVAGASGHAGIGHRKLQIANLGEAAPGESATQTVGAFCAIGNPDGFRRTLVDLGFVVGYFRTFPDHHHYASADLDEVTALARSSGCGSLLTTQKDLVKIQRDELSDLPLWAVQIGVRFLSGENRFTAALDKLRSRLA